MPKNKNCIGDFSTIMGGHGNTASPISTTVKKENKIKMDQYVLSRKKLLKALEQAFIAGYESPLEMIEQEIGQIYKDSFAELHAVGVSQEKSKLSHHAQRQVMFDTDAIFDADHWS